MSANNVFRHYNSENGQGGPSQPVSAPVYTPSPARPKKKRWLIVVAVIVLFFWAIVMFGAFGYYNEASLSTRVRKPLSNRPADDISFYDYEDFLSDETGWLDYKFIVSSGLRDFYEETGILPYVYITDNVNGSASPTGSELKAFAKGIYHELFTDQAHLLFVYVYTMNGYMDCYECGTLAAGVFDEEAGIILQDYVDKYQTVDSLSNSQFLGKVFTKTGGRIMTRTASPWGSVIVFVILAAIFAFFIIRQQRKYKEALEELETKELLQIPLEKFCDPEIEELMDKYDDET
jgi:hypothetical protein